MTESDFWFTLLAAGGVAMLVGFLFALLVPGLQALLNWLPTGTVGMVILGVLAGRLGEPLLWAVFVAVAAGFVLGYDLSEAI